MGDGPSAGEPACEALLGVVVSMVMGLTEEQMEAFTRAHESLVAQMKRRGRGFEYSIESLKGVETLCGGFRLLREQEPARAQTMAGRSAS